MTKDLTTGNAPKHLQNAPGAAVGVDEAGKHSSLPRFKIVQAQAKDDELIAHGTGALVLDKELIVKAGVSFRATPVFFWRSYAKIRDYDDKSPDFWLADESLDPESETGKFALDFNNRIQPYPDNPDLKYHYAELLNFALVTHNGPSAIYSWMKGEHKIGRDLCKYVARQGREPNCVSIFGNVLEFATREERNPKGDRYQVLGFSVPDQCWVSNKGLYEAYAKQHKVFATAHAEKTIGVNRADGEET